MGTTGIIGGTVFLGNRLLDSLDENVIQTEFGIARVLVSSDFFYIPRHGVSREPHILPHCINHRANIRALKELGASEILGICSTGSLRKDIPPGSLVIADDFICMIPGLTTITEHPHHIAPVLNEELRQHLITTASRCRIPARERGVYWQTQGPRFETRAEIRMMAQFADIVGMTMASEAIIAGEMDIPYAAICSVDNYGHGIGDGTLTVDEIVEGSRNNADAVLTIIAAYVSGR
jgi:5'-methylthioadenosine phosphorylase